MIKTASGLSPTFLECLKDNHYTRRVKTNFQAYSCKYDFCRFFVLKDDDDVKVAVINQFNSTMTITTIKDFELSQDNLSELVTLIKLNKPQTIEMESCYASYLKDNLDEYNTEERTEFEYSSKKHLPNLIVDECPKLDDVATILITSFPAIASGYDLWLTDTSHRIRRGMSQCFLLGDFTTATIQYISSGVVLIGNVATLPHERGKFHARKLLYWLGEKLSNDGFTVKLFARSNRVTYYEEIGFREGPVDLVFERKFE